MTEMAQRKKVRELEHELKNFQAMVVNGRTESEKQHARNRVNEVSRELQRAKAGSLVAGGSGWW